MSYGFPFKRKKSNAPAIDHRTYETGLHVFADGACEPNPGPGGWAFVVFKDGDEVHSEGGGLAQTTNNIMEMTGALRALEWLAKNCPDRQASLHCDSQYVVNGCNDWRHSWKSKGWTRGKEEVKNLALWQLLDAALESYPLRLTWCKGHAGIKGNERADALSVEAMRDVTTAAIGSH
ncbi:ribonuclease H [Neorhizobium sp. CSC1952]|uniref:ribonuclease H family protein n=1 Tax=Neorhizobium sp. CSC1952 TaxID=2978974 RepID=UPI0025A65703|nr:ribonuclease H [Rhizobium sp. CSC1952]WJR67250.1 ribonuclease H [Rhizobium sp. CSC1952]